MYPEYGGDEYDAGFKVGYDTARDKYEPALAATQALVREMGKMLNQLNCAALRVGFEWRDKAQEILTRPEVRAIMEGKDGTE